MYVSLSSLLMPPLGSLLNRQFSDAFSFKYTNDKQEVSSEHSKVQNADEVAVVVLKWFTAGKPSEIIHV